MPLRFRIPSLVVIVSVGALGVDLSTAAESLTQAADELAARLGRQVGGPVQLFNGKSLDGWTTFSGEPVAEGWDVQRGELVRVGRGGAIYAEGEYEDFILDFEWKIAPGCNSGLKYRVQFYDVGVRRRPGWLGCEYQIDDDVKNPQSLGSTGALYSLYPPNDKKRVHPPGEYNTSRIVIAGTRIEHWLNGEKIVEADTASDEWRRRVADSKFRHAKGFGENRRGRIQVQDHGGKIWFRSITLRPLEAEQETRPLADGRKPAP